MAVVDMERITDLADAQGISLVDLASAVGVSPSVYYMLRRGDRQDMIGATLRNTARVLNTSADYLLGLTDDPRPGPPSAGLTVAESRLVYEVAGAEDDIRELLRLFEGLAPDQRAILRQVAEQMLAASRPRIVE